MNKTLISIIVPVYNTETYLSKCIYSLLNQTYENIEIILVNDGSTDKSLDVCHNFATQYKNIRVIDQANMGVSAARNTGIKASKGDFLTFVDSDDKLCSDAIQSMYDLIMEHTADVVDAAMICDEKQTARKKSVEFSCNVLSGNCSALYSLSEVSFSACAKLFRKQSILGVFFEEGRHLNEDGFFVFECYLKRLTVVVTDKIVYQYSERECSSSRSCFSVKNLDMLYFLEKKKMIESLFPEYLREMRQLELRTNLNFLQLLCNSNLREYGDIEKTCLLGVKNGRNATMKRFRKYEKRLYFIIHMDLYPLYKLIVRKR